MNALSLGLNKDALIPYVPNDDFLLVDDGPFIDALLAKRPELPVRHFDIHKDTFNPLKDMNRRRARELAGILYAPFPQGENTLTVRNGKRALAPLLLAATRLDAITGNKKDPAIAEALATVDDVLFSDVLKRVLNGPDLFSFQGTIVARLDRAELGDFDCFVLGNLIVERYAGQVIITDFGFYAHQGHTSLIRQNRLIAGVNTLSEIPAMRDLLLTIDRKIACHSTVADAETLAGYSGILPGTNAYNHFIAESIS